MLFGAVLSFCAAGSASARWELIQADMSGVVAEWSSPVVRIDTVVVAGQRTLQPVLEDCSADGEPGSPAIPKAGALIAVPDGAQASAAAVAGEWETRSGLLSPVPSHELREDGLGYRRVFEIRPEAYSAQDMGTDLVSLEPAGEAYGAHLVRIVVHPVRANVADKRFAITRSVRVRVQFTSLETPSLREFIPLPSVWEGAVLNAAAHNALHRASGGAADRVGRVAEASPFASGVWLRVVVDADAMYKITAAALAEADSRFRNAAAERLALYAGSGRELPLDPQKPRQNALRPVRPIVVDANGDGVFNGTDYLLFYGRSPSGWDLDYQTLDPVYALNHYTYENVYWLTISPAASVRAEVRSGAVSDPSLPVIERFPYRFHEEPEVTNLNEEGDTDGPYSGVDWQWDQLAPQASRVLQVALLDVAGDTVGVRVGQLRQFSAYGSLQVKVNGVVEPLVDQRQTSTYAWCTGYAPVITPAAQVSLPVEIRNASTGYPIILDYYEIAYWRRFVVRGSSFAFVLPPLRSAVPSARVVVPLSGVDRTQHRLFEVSDDSGLVEYTLPLPDDQGITRVELRQSGLIERKYLVVAESDWRTPLRMEPKTSATNLRGRTAGVDYVVITHPDFQAEASRLADMRAQKNGFRTAVVTTRDIYDEFSFGMFDPAALRDFLRHAFMNWRDGAADQGLRYAVLLGDGQFDYRNLTRFTTSTANPQPGNWVPPYQEGPVTTDDWFVVFDNTGIASVKIGRLCVQTKEEARAVVGKIIAYERDPERGAWQNRAIMIADDEYDLDRGINSEDYVDDSERMAGCLRAETVTEKIYSHERQLNQQMQKPSVNRMITDAWSRGAALINYVGHGNPVLWAHERIFTLDGDLPNIVNGKRLPVLTALTCSAAHFDAPSTQSMAEVLVNMANGGAAATVAATRLSYNTENVGFNEIFLSRLYGGAEGRTPRIGDAFWYAKALAAQNPGWLYRQNARKYVLIGDPALTVALPELVVQVQMMGDSLRALAASTLRGSVLVPGATDTLRSFSGSALVNVFDSATPMSYQAAGGNTILYTKPGTSIFRGVVPVQNGVFTTELILPIEVSYGGTQAKAVAQVWNDQIDGAGSIGGLAICSRPAASVRDTTGPSIVFTRADDLNAAVPLRDGAEIPRGEPVRVWLADPLGVNVSGGIGHRLVAYLNGNRSAPVDLTEDFVHWGSATTGWADILLSNDLTAQQVVVEAWDNGNNFAADSVFLRVGRGKDIAVSNVIAYPNPMARDGAFTFVLDGVGASAEADATVRVFTVAGRLVDTVTKLGVTDGPVVIPWTPAHQLANGVYLYQISIRRRSDGRTAKALERLAVVGP